MIKPNDELRRFLLEEYDDLLASWDAMGPGLADTAAWPSRAEEAWADGYSKGKAALREPDAKAEAAWAAEEAGRDWDDYEGEDE